MGKINLKIGRWEYLDALTAVDDSHNAQGHGATRAVGPRSRLRVAQNRIYRIYQTRYDSR